MVFVDLLISTLTQGFIYALLSYGVFITYKILDFPDLTVDGSFPLGAAITGVLLIHGVNPFLVLLISAAIGALAGFITGYIHVRLGVRDLLAGIITMTALFSINLQIAGSNLAVGRDIDTIFNAAPIMAMLGSMPLMMRKFIVSLILALVVKLLLDLYLKTKSGLLLRAVGDNSTLVTTLAKDKGTTKILGLVIANALVALCGSVVCQEQRSFSSTMGTGQVVFGLATVIIGTTLFRRFGFVKGTTAVLTGSIFYKICIQVAISLGLPANLLKLAMAVLFLVILVLGDRKKGGAEHA
ncbi:ABC transporter permease [Anaerotignum propionicum]|jgi:putative ABC transport system permease protein|uniref:ABC transport system permease protein n=1 Tax=Anaerotignum propionicum DSM 1682 TaxID=991789 RepID=A0A0X1U6S6_ANAPI|nr:ABC transporter [Anaerotignum propionicum]AMJ40646.1 branched-chain amino acid transport system / permease component [Anaerotignum propionicum DSM 1682]MEA5058019.1 ABC transporter permease [Anaerotignum propionicum]SHE91026.1 putative ABC transport system permease protein [[Clostridium] propionicum DSM 1682] [Anaerotignum propionicum DSM 1682]HBF66311.1 ABC transporter permease [Clostridium sp.]